MKKLTTLSFLLVLFILLCGCGNSTATKKGAATITNNDSKTEHLTHAELIELSKNDSAEFERKYEGAKITFTATIKEIMFDRQPAANSLRRIDYIVCEEGWFITQEAGATNWKSLNYRDKIEVSSIIAAASSSNIWIGDMFGNKVTISPAK